GAEQRERAEEQEPGGAGHAESPSCDELSRGFLPDEARESVIPSRRLRRADAAAGAGRRAGAARRSSAARRSPPSLPRPTAPSAAAGPPLPARRWRRP